MSRPESIGRFVAVVGGATTTITVAGNDPDILVAGSVSTGTFGGENWAASQGNVSFDVTGGTSLVLRILPYEAPYYIYIDGVLVETIGNSAAWADFTYSITTARHSVMIAAQAFGANVYWSLNDFIELTGVGPSVFYPSGYSTPLINAFESVSGTYVVDDGTATDSTYGRGSSGWLRFMATTSRIRAFVASGESLILYQDGVYVGEGTYSSDGLGWIDLGATNGSHESEYWLRQNSPNGNYINRISASGVNTAALAARDRWTFMGDSITYGFGLSYRYAWANLTSINKGVAHINRGQSGHSLVTDASSVGGWATADAPKYVVINYGYNDIGGVINDFRNAVYDALHALCGVASVTKIYYPGIWNYSGDGANRTTWNSAIQSICAGGPDASARTLTAPEIAKITYLNTNGVLSSWADGIHPDATGAQQIATFLIANIT